MKGHMTRAQIIAITVSLWLCNQNSSAWKPTYTYNHRGSSNTSHACLLYTILVLSTLCSTGPAGLHSLLAPTAAEACLAWPFMPRSCFVPCFWGSLRWAFLVCQRSGLACLHLGSDSCSTLELGAAFWCTARSRSKQENKIEAVPDPSSARKIRPSLDATRTRNK